MVAQHGGPPGQVVGDRLADRLVHGQGADVVHDHDVGAVESRGELRPARWPRRVDGEAADDDVRPARPGDHAHVDPEPAQRAGPLRRGDRHAVGHPEPVGQDRDAYPGEVEHSRMVSARGGTVIPQAV
jgi:hypothetical protein